MKRLLALRGAITANENTREAIKEATQELLQVCMERNAVEIDDIVSIIFTMTEDLDAEFPAVAARDLGMSHVPLLCARELEISGSISSCIRVLIHFYSGKDKSELHHAYLREARQLRMDLPE